MSLHCRRLARSPRWHCLIHGYQQWTRLSIKSPGVWDVSRNAGSHKYWIVYLLFFVRCIRVITAASGEKPPDLLKEKVLVTGNNAGEKTDKEFVSVLPSAGFLHDARRCKRKVQAFNRWPWVFCSGCDIFFYYPCLRGSSAANYPFSAST